MTCVTAMDLYSKDQIAEMVKQFRKEWPHFEHFADDMKEAMVSHYVLNVIVVSGALHTMPTIEAVRHLLRQMRVAVHLDIPEGI